MNDRSYARPTVTRRGAMLAALTAVTLLALYIIHDALLPFIVAIAVAFVFDPVIAWLQPRMGGKRWVPAATLFVVLLIVSAGFAYWIGSLFVADLSGLAQNGPRVLHDLIQQVIGPGGVSVFGTTYTPDALTKQLQDALAGAAGPIGYARVGQIGLELLLGLFLTLVLIPYLLISGPRVMDGAIWLLPPSRRGAARRELLRLAPVLRRYLVGVSVVVLFTAVAAWLGFGLAFHLPHAILLSFVVGVLEIIPALGPFASMVLIGLAALQQHSIASVLLLMAYAIVLRLAIDNGVGPVVLGRSAKLHPVAVIFAFVVGGTLLGVIGLLLAVPVAASIVVVLEDRYREPEEEA